MKMNTNIIRLLIGCLFLWNCAKKDDIPTNLVAKDFVWKGMNAYYLHQDKIPDLSDRRFSSQFQLNDFLSTFATPQELFTSLIYTQPPNTDTQSFLIDDYTQPTNIPYPRVSRTRGMEFGIIEEPGHAQNVIGYVLYILPNSDAATKTITRGEFFNQVDGTQLTKNNYRNLLLNGNNSITIHMVNFDGTTVTPTTKTVALTKGNYTHNTIFQEKVFNQGGKNIGYIMFNNDFTTHIKDLNSSFQRLKTQNVNELILDLRYNIAGNTLDKTVSQLASMITGQFPNEVFLKRRWNTKAQPWFEANQPDSLLLKFPTRIDANTAIHSLQLTDIYIISNEFTSSAIELLMNSLQSHINVHFIGNQTTGNNTGSITLYNSEDYDFANRNMTHTFALQPIVLTFLNKNDQSYPTGVTPTAITCRRENILNLGVLGELSDPLLNRTLNYVATGNSGNSGTCNPMNFQFVYHSVQAQQLQEIGVFIEQDLPNTNL